MTKEELLSYFISNGESFNIKKTCVMLLIGLAVGLVIYATYYICCNKTVYNRKFNGTILVTLLITELIMMMISSNIAVSLGMVGALSIIRFRTAVKDSRDTIFLFWAIAEGLCVGTQSYKMVAVSIIFIAVVFILLSKVAGVNNKYLLIVTGGEKEIDIAAVEEKMNPYIVNKSIRTANKNQNHQEYIFEVKTKKELNLKVIDELMAVNGVDTVNWVVESGDVAG